MSLPEESQPITADNIDAILKFLPEFEQEGCEFGHMTLMEQTPDGAFVLPDCVLGKTGSRLAVLARPSGAILPSPREASIGRHQHDPPVADYTRSEGSILWGHLLSAFKSGHLTAVLRRLQAIRQADTMIETDEA